MMQQRRMSEITDLSDVPTEDLHSNADSHTDRQVLLKSAHQLKRMHKDKAEKDKFAAFAVLLDNGETPVSVKNSPATQQQQQQQYGYNQAESSAQGALAGLKTSQPQGQSSAVGEAEEQITRLREELKMVLQAANHHGQELIKAQGRAHEIHAEISAMAAVKRVARSQGQGQGSGFRE